MNNLPVSTRYPSGLLRIDATGLVLWFIHNMPVAFRVGFNPTVVRVNTWNQAIGRAMEIIDSGELERRVGLDEFHMLWDEQVEPIRKTIRREMLVPRRKKPGPNREK